MPVAVPPKQKEINAENANQLQSFNWSKYRHVVFQASLSTVPLELIRIVAENIAENVETINGGFSRKIDDFFSALLQAPFLKELTLEHFDFAFQEAVGEYFATTRTLKTLSLSHCHVFGDAKGIEVATAFRKGLRRNQTLTQVHFSPAPAKHGPFVQEFFLGIKENRYVQELSLHLPPGEWPSDPNLLALRGLVADTTSIQKLRLSTSILVEIFLGLASNKSIQDVEIEAVFEVGNEAGRAENAIRECFATNKTLRVFKMESLFSLGPLSPAALVNGLSQSESLTTFCANGSAVSPDVLQHVAKLHSASFVQLDNPDWTLLSRSIRSAQRDCNLQVLDLSKNRLSAQNLETILPSLSRLSELSLEDCGITFEGVPVICDFIGSSRQLKKLNLSSNPFSSQGAASILAAVSNSTSMERLDMARPRLPLGGDDTRIITINQCHESLRTLLQAADSRLVFLDLSHCESLGMDAIGSIAAGLRANVAVKTIKLPWLGLAFIGVVGEALTVNRSLKSFEVNSVSFCSIGRRRTLKVLDAANEDGIISFVGMMPRMKSLVCIKNLFDFKPSKRLNDALIAAMKENMVLEEIHGDSKLVKDFADHVCNNENIEFFLELNRLGRRHDVAASESNPVPVGAQPHLLARMTQPECRSHLYYFLRRTSPANLTVGQEYSSGLKRKAAVSS